MPCKAEKRLESFKKELKEKGVFLRPDDVKTYLETFKEMEKEREVNTQPKPKKSKAKAKTNKTKEKGTTDPTKSDNTVEPINIHFREFMFETSARSAIKEMLGLDSNQMAMLKRIYINKASGKPLTKKQQELFEYVESRGLKVRSDVLEGSELNTPNVLETKFNSKTLRWDISEQLINVKTWDDVRNILANLISIEKDSNNSIKGRHQLYAMVDLYENMGLPLEPFTFKIVKENGTRAGNWNYEALTGSYTIFINSNINSSVKGKADNFIHEITHHLTGLQLVKNPELLSEIDDIRKYTIDYLKKNNPKALEESKFMYALNAKKTDDPSDPNYFKNALEFVAEATTNPNTVRLLKSIPARGGKSVFDKVISTLRKLFNKESVPENLFEEMLEKTLAIASMNPNGDMLISDMDISLDDEVHTKESSVVNMAKDFSAVFNNLLGKDAEEGRLKDVDRTFVTHAAALNKQIEALFLKTAPSYTLDVTVEESTEKESKLEQEAAFKNGTFNLVNNPDNRTTSYSETWLTETLRSLAKDFYKANPRKFNKIKKLRSLMYDRFDYSLFLHKANDGTGEFTKEEINTAKKRFDTVFAKEGDITDFFAEVMGNSILLNAANQSILEDSQRDKDMSEIFSDIISSPLTGKESNAMLENMMKHYVDLKNRELEGDPLIPRKYEEKEGIVGLSSSLINTTYDTFEKVVDVLRSIGIPVNSVLVKAIKKLLEWRDDLFDTVKRGSSSEIALQMSKLPVIRQTIKSNILQSLFRSMFTDTARGDYRDFYKMFRQSKQVVNKVVLDSKSSIKHIIGESSLHHSDNQEMNTEFTDKVFNTGLYRYFKEFVDNDYLFDQNKLTKDLEDLEKKALWIVGNDSVMMHHLDALAKYSIDGEAHIRNQQINVDNIVRGLYDPETVPLRLSSENLDLLDRYVAMKVMKMSDLENIRNGITHENYQEVIELSEAFKKIYNRVVSGFRKGKNKKTALSIPYNFKEVERDANEYRIDLVRHGEEGLLEKFKTTIIDKTPIIINGIKYYKAKRLDIDIPYDEGIIKLTNIKQQGLSLRGLIHQELRRDGKVITQKKLEAKTSAVMRLLKGGKDLSKLINFQDKLIPIYSEFGDIEDYVLPLSKKDKETHLNETPNLLDTIPKSIAKLKNIEISKLNNKKAIDLLLAYYDENPEDDYITIGSKSFDEEDKQSWDLLPLDVKNYIYETTGSSVLHIPKTVANQVLGFKTASISNASVFGKTLKNKTNRDTLIYAERIVKDTLSYFKGILIKFNPSIGIGNTISNMFIAGMYGVSPSKYYTEFTKNWNLLRDYENTSQQLSKLRVFKSMGRDVQNQIDTLQKKLDSSEFKSIVDDGQFTPLIDDMDEGGVSIFGNKLNEHIMTVRDSDGEYTEEFKKEVKREAIRRIREEGDTRDLDTIVEEVSFELEDKTHVNGKVADVFKFMFGLKGSSSEEVAARFVAYGDTLTRQIIYNKRMTEISNKNKEEGKEVDVTEDQRQDLLNELDQLLVNYSYLSNKYQSWAESVGGLFFLKYLLKARKGYQMLWQRLPLVATLGELMQDLTVDISDPTDSMPIDLLGAIENRVQTDNPLEIVWNVATPSVQMPITDFQVNSLYK